MSLHDDGTTDALESEELREQYEATVAWISMPVGVLRIEIEMSDTGKRWWKVTGLEEGDYYAYAGSHIEARESAAQAWLIAEPVPDQEALDWFDRMAKEALGQGLT